VNDGGKDLGVHHCWVKGGSVGKHRRKSKRLKKGKVVDDRERAIVGRRETLI